eukprot:511511_1
MSSKQCRSSYNKIITVDQPNNLPIGMSTHQFDYVIKCKNGEKIIFKPGPMQLNEKEKDYQFGMVADQYLSLWYDEKQQELMKHPILIRTWDDYAHEASDGRIAQHFTHLIVVTNEAVTKPINCVHQHFRNISECINKLFEVLYGSPFHYKTFDEQDLCYNCLLTFCSKKKEIKKLFEDWYDEYTKFAHHKFDIHMGMNCKELFYLSQCLLKYKCMVKYILNRPSLYNKLFSLFIFYIKHFKILVDLIKKDSNIFDVFHTDQGYTLQRRSLVIIYCFDYNFLSIVGCMMKLIPYFKRTHLLRLLELDYFTHFQCFMSLYLDLKHHIILFNKVQIHLNNDTRFLGTVTLWQSLSVFEFINYKITLKRQLLVSSLKRNKILKICQQIAKIKKWFTDYDTKSWWNSDLYMNEKDKLKVLCFQIKEHPFFGIGTILKDKKTQLRKDIRCGNYVCIKKVNHRKFKLCSNCKIVYYCCRRCQKINWSHHKTFCCLFI